MEPASNTAYPDPLAKAEAYLVEQRRAAVEAHEQQQPLTVEQMLGEGPQPMIGVGLSGGGIRSATFCLGVFQSLAASNLLRRIDFLSTVSGGGYFGSFLGRLFTREWVRTHQDVADVLQSKPSHTGRGWQAFRFLRDNGRYLAPRGSGDLLMMLSVALRNWMSVQVVLITLALTFFVGLQAIVLSFPEWGAWIPADVLAAMRDGLATIAPQSQNIRWSWWFVPLVPVVMLWFVPTCWAYWAVGQSRSGAGLFRRSEIVVSAIAGAIVWWQGVVVSTALGAVLVVAAATFVWASVANWQWWRRTLLRLIGRAPAGDNAAQFAVDDATRARNRLSAWFKGSLIAAISIGVVASIDTLGATVQALTATDKFVPWLGGLAASIGGVAAFGRQLLVLIGGRTSGPPKVKWSIVMWLAAVMIAGGWLIGVSVLSHQIAATGAGVAERRDFTAMVLLVLVVLTVVFGYSRVFLNLSTLHAFYSQRLTRAYLGASNQDRLANARHVTDVVPGDDIPADVYWNWPRPVPQESLISRIHQSDVVQRLQHGLLARFGALRQLTFMQDVDRHASDGQAGGGLRIPPMVAAGGPLHLLNVTVNETLDGRTGVQQQDRKGISLTIGPAGFSLGVAHHLVADRARGHVALGREEHRVFGALESEPERLTLGRWASISGAAFTPAAGAQTSVPQAILATFANVRLGYWWDSGLRRAGSRLFPVYRGLLAEGLARLRGTSERLWNISDGGHFENLGGYELIRRRLPLVILIDAEADPDFGLSGLANLVRKARLDFGAEIAFLNNDADGIPDTVKTAFGSLETLRRNERAAYSRSHAALARVSYDDGRVVTWLVYVKASVTGDEPADVLQYHREHVDFPHESTADQFFDEAQWESYRRLGEHLADQVLTPAVFSLGRGVGRPAAT